MEEWTEANLFKLSVKELKSLARKRNVNTNSKKADLVKALLSNVVDVSDPMGTDGPDVSKRMTRSRRSIWQASVGNFDSKKENTTGKLRVEEVNSNSGFKESVDGQKLKKKRPRVTDNTDTNDTAEMFPLVNIINLVSKPLVYISNNVVKNHQDKHDELQTVNDKNKRSKSDSQDSNRKIRNINQIEIEHTKEEQNLQPSIQLHKQCITNNSNDKIEIGTENQLDSTFISVARENSFSEKPKRGKKRKCKSPVKDKISPEDTIVQCESSGTSYPDINSRGSNKSKRSRDNECSSNEIKPDNDKPIVKKLLDVTDILPEISDSVFKMKRLSASNETKLYDSKKRKIRSPLTENSSDDSQNDFPETDQKKSKRRKSMQPLETCVSNSIEKPKDEKRKRGKGKKQELPKVDEGQKTQELTEITVAETSDNSSSLQRSSRKSGSLPNCQNESVVVESFKNDSAKKSATKKHNSNENILEENDVSGVQSETVEVNTQVPVRSSTFILSDSVAGITGEAENMPVAALLRSGTFILSDTDGKSPHRKSLRFSLGQELEKKPHSTQDEVVKRGKSIGQRIMKTTRQQGYEKPHRQQHGSTLKATLEKGVKTPGSVIKKRAVCKMPNFKKIHQHLFNNMESLSEHKKRQLDRAQELILSPMVPRCATVTPKPKIAGNAERSSLKPAQNTKMRTPVAHSPLATRLKTPEVSRTPVAALKPVPGPSSVNRFGFRKPVKKEEATSIIGKKLPTINIEKKKEKERHILKGVRTNKRFMLQMKMRQQMDKEEK